MTFLLPDHLHCDGTPSTERLAAGCNRVRHLLGKSMLVGSRGLLDSADMALASVYSSSVGNSIHASANQRESQKVGCTGPIRHAMPPSLTTLHTCCTNLHTKRCSTMQSLPLNHALHTVSPMNLGSDCATPFRYSASGISVTGASAACKEILGVAVNASGDQGRANTSLSLDKCWFLAGGQPVRLLDASLWLWPILYAAS